MPAETAPLTAFRASGRLMVMTATAVVDLDENLVRHFSLQLWLLRARATSAGT